MNALIRPSKKRRHPRGFATFIALALVALVALASAALMRSFSTQAHRTHNEAVDAQLRQLLIAGATQAAAMSHRGQIANGPMEIVLPDKLGADGMKVSLRFIRAKDAASVEIKAQHGSRQMHETLQLSHH